MSSSAQNSTQTHSWGARRPDEDSSTDSYLYTTVNPGPSPALPNEGLYETFNTVLPDNSNWRRNHMLNVRTNPSENSVSSNDAVSWDSNDGASTLYTTLHAVPPAVADENFAYTSVDGNERTSLNHSLSQMSLGSSSASGSRPLPPHPTSPPSTPLCNRDVQTHNARRTSKLIHSHSAEQSLVYTTLDGVEHQNVNRPKSVLMRGARTPAFPSLNPVEVPASTSHSTPNISRSMSGNNIVVPGNDSHETPPARPPRRRSSNDMIRTNKNGYLNCRPSKLVSRSSLGNIPGSVRDSSPCSSTRSSITEEIIPVRPPRRRPSVPSASTPVSPETSNILAGRGDRNIGRNSMPNCDSNAETMGYYDSPQIIDMNSNTRTGQNRSGPSTTLCGAMYDMPASNGDIYDTPQGLDQLPTESSRSSSTQSLSLGDSSAVGLGICDTSESAYYGHAQQYHQQIQGTGQSSPTMLHNSVRRDESHDDPQYHFFTDDHCEESQYQSAVSVEHFVPRRSREPNSTPTSMNVSDGSTAATNMFMRENSTASFDTNMSVEETTFFLHTAVSMSHDERRDHLKHVMDGQIRGSWLLRFNCSKGLYVLSVKDIVRIRNLWIGNKHCQYQLCGKSFKSLFELCNYFTHNAPIEEIGFKLTMPIDIPAVLERLRRDSNARLR